MLSIGLMSGTSMDGIDAALLETDGSPNLIRDLGSISLSYPAPFKILLKAAEYAVRHCRGNIHDTEIYYPQGVRDYLFTELKISEINIPEKLAELNYFLNDGNHRPAELNYYRVIQKSTYFHEQAVKKLLLKTELDAQQINVIGYHGQTFFHQPENKISIIVGNGAELAASLGITVVNDFRSRDIEAGGQGAPFAPLYHHALAIKHQKTPLIIANCGGIANITFIPNEHEKDLIAFDTGPGNALVDRLIKQRTQGRESMDTDGQYGLKGRVHPPTLKALYQSAVRKNNGNYLGRLPPKSLDIGDLQLVPELEALSLEDACATLEAFTADVIISSLDLVALSQSPQWILAGGGWHNPVILRELKQRLNKKFKKTPLIQTADEAGWNSQGMEAQIFAYLAVRSLQNKPLSLPNITGVAVPLTGGQIHFSEKS